MGILAAKLTKKNLHETDFNRLAVDVQERLLKVSSPEKIYIFGSFAAHKVSLASDLDIAILFSDVDQLKKYKKIILNGKLFLDFSTDLLFFTVKEFEKRSNVGGVCTEIANKGIVIYDKRTKI